MKNPFSFLTIHPKGLYMLFTTEMWERFNFYGMRSLFTLFLVNAMMYDEGEASLIYGAYLGLSYLMPILGGYMADNVIGTRKAVLLGGMLMALGQLTLFLSASIYDINYDMASITLWGAVGLLIFGNGFFKPNISSTVGGLYSAKDKRLDSAYTIFYMGINFGAFLGMAICPFLGDVYDSNGVRDISAFRWGFLAAGIAMIIGTLTFYILKNKYLKMEDGTEIGLPPVKKTASEVKESTSNSGSVFAPKMIALASGLFVILLATFYFFSSGGIVQFIYAFIYALGISLALLILFGDSSLTKIEKEKIIVLYVVSFFVIFFWACFEQAGSSLSFVADYQTDRRLFGINLPPSSIQNANSIFIIIFSLPFAFLWTWLDKKNINIISPVKQAIGLILLSIGYLIIAWKIDEIGNTGKVAVVWLIVMYLFHTLGELCLSPIGLSLVSKLAPVKFISLLMGVWFLANASGYALAGTLGSLLPPTGDKYMKAEKIGVSLQEVLENKIELTAEQIQLFSEQSIPIVYPEIFGITIIDLFDFFMVFVVLSFSAGLLLLFISPLLKRMMHGIK